MGKITYIISDNATIRIAAFSFPQLEEVARTGFDEDFEDLHVEPHSEDDIDSLDYL